ncbi:MAG: hypothetical protein JO262_02220 [Solirubrobacterales bacterium]|nr:hypothetical protein [Solirubrobacterales bacterium]
MAQHGAVDGSDPPSAAQVTVVQVTVMEVTVVPGPRRRTATARAGRLVGRGAAGLMVLGAVVGALLVGGEVGMFRGAAARPPTVVPSAAVADAVPLAAATQAYRFPLGCLRITRTRAALAGAVRRRSDPCRRYGVYVTAILRRVGGTWRLALEASGRSCPRVALAAPARGQLAVCRQ